MVCSKGLYDVGQQLFVLFSEQGGCRTLTCRLVATTDWLPVLGQTDRWFARWWRTRIVRGLLLPRPASQVPKGPAHALGSSSNLSLLCSHGCRLLDGLCCAPLHVLGALPRLVQEALDVVGSTYDLRRRLRLCPPCLVQTSQFQRCTFQHSAPQDQEPAFLKLLRHEQPPPYRAIATTHGSPASQSPALAKHPTILERSHTS